MAWEFAVIFMNLGFSVLLFGLSFSFTRSNDGDGESSKHRLLALFLFWLGWLGLVTTAGISILIIKFVEPTATGIIEILSIVFGILLLLFLIMVMYFMFDWIWFYLTNNPTWLFLKGRNRKKGGGFGSG